MEPIIDALTAFTAVQVAVLLVAVGYGIYLWARGSLPALIRLGSGLARRRIAIFAKPASLESLTALLADSRLFRSTNMIGIPTRNDFGRADSASVLLIHFPDWEQNELESIVSNKPDSTPLVVYAPQSAGRVPDEFIQLLESQRNVVLTNFRGRLLNDIVISLITSSYEKR